MTRGALSLCSVAVAFAIPGLGCKSDEDPGAAFITRYCDIYKPCCAAAGLPADGKACQELFAGARTPQAQYNTTAGESCLSTLQLISGQPGFCEGDVTPPFTCAQAFGGSVGTCIQDNDCPASAEGDVRCVSGFVSGAQVRKCQIQIRGQAGSTPCVGSVRGNVALYSGTSSGDVPDQGYICYAADSLRCDGTACIALKATGELCELSSDCGEADFCDASTGMCAARKATGAACIGQALECQDGSFCDEAGGLLCAAQRAVGAACTENVQCLTGNCPNGTCETTPPVGPSVLCGGGG